MREAALVALLAPFGAASHLVLAAGLVWEAVIISGGLVAGAAALLLRRSTTSQSDYIAHGQLSRRVLLTIFAIAPQ